MSNLFCLSISISSNIQSLKLRYRLFCRLHRIRIFRYTTISIPIWFCPSILIFGIKPFLILLGTLSDILPAVTMFLSLFNPMITEIPSLSKILERPFQKLTFLICLRHFIGQTNQGTRQLEEAVWGYTLSKQFLTCMA